MANCILVPIDGSANSTHAVQYLIDRRANLTATEIHLLNVQLPIRSGESASETVLQGIRQIQDTAAAGALEEARRLLDRAGIAYRCNIKVGEAAETIAHYAHECGCDSIVMGTRGLGSIKSLVLGSVATKVIHLADVPVTLVK